MMGAKLEKGERLDLPMGTVVNVHKLVNMPGSTFNGELQEKYNVVLSGYLARNKDRELKLFLEPKDMSRRKFIRLSIDGFWQWCLSDARIDDKEVVLDRDLFPDVKWEDDYPTEVQIRIM